MDLKRLQNKKILLFGKSRAFSTEEFASQLAAAKIELSSGFTPDVALVVEGKMMTPYEQNQSDELYEKHSGSVEFAAIDALERELVKNINSNALLMSLKLGRDKARLKSFLQNSMIGDELFFKLLGMYSWGGEDFFDNDDNRDVSAAIILRFYKNIERNHNVQYATSGFMHLVSQTDDAALIEAIAALEPLQKSLHVASDANRNILAAISAHRATPKRVLKEFIRKAGSELKTVIAMREDLDEEMQNALFETNEPKVLEALSVSKSLSRPLLEELSKEPEYASNIAGHIKLDDKLFERFLQGNGISLAKNPSLNKEMQKRLLKGGAKDIHVELAKNVSLDGEVAKELLGLGDEEILLGLYKNAALSGEEFEKAYKDPRFHEVLACNKNTPNEILARLANSDNPEVLMGVAKNTNTPVEALYQLQLDARFARAVKENSAFGAYIQQYNIGWQV